MNTDGLFQRISTYPMDEIGNPLRNAQWVWLEIQKFPPNFVNFNRNSRKTIKIFVKFWNSSRFWISRFWNPAKKLQFSFFSGTQFSVVHGGGVGYFLEQPNVWQVSRNFLCARWKQSVLFSSVWIKKTILSLAKYKMAITARHSCSDVGMKFSK